MIISLAEAASPFNSLKSFRVTVSTFKLGTVGSATLSDNSPMTSRQSGQSLSLSNASSIRHLSYQRDRFKKKEKYNDNF